MLKLVFALLGCFTLTSALAQFPDASTCLEDPLRHQQAAHHDGSAVAEIMRRHGQAQVPARVSKVFDRLVAKAELPADVRPRLSAYRGRNFNAHAAADGTILVSQAVWGSRYKLADSELAMVLAHEIAHVKLQHSALQGCRAVSLVGNPALTVAQARGELAHSHLLDHAWTALATEVEHEADDVGFALMKSAGFNPEGAAGLFWKLAALSGGGLNAKSRTHPALQERLYRVSMR